MALALKEIIDSRGISADELAEQTGFSKAMIWNYGSGRRNPDPEQLCILADALDVSLDLLVRGKEKAALCGRSKEDLMKMFSEMSEEEIKTVLEAYKGLSPLAKKAFWSNLIKSITPTENGYDFTVNYT